MSPKNPYVPPRVQRHDFFVDSREHKEKLTYSLPIQDELTLPSAAATDAEYVTLVDLDRRYVRVSDDFCKLLGYDSDSLIGKRYDDLTAPGSADICTVFNLFCQLEYMHGLWMFVARGGAHILVRYEAWLRSDSLIEAQMQVVPVGHNNA